MAWRHSRRSKTIWLESDKDLINFVKENPIIYNPAITQLDGVKRNLAVERIWHIYGQKIKRPASEVAKRWKSICDTYKRYLKHPDKVGTQSKYLDRSLSFLGELPVSTSPIVNLTDENMGALKVTSPKSPLVINWTAENLRSSNVPPPQASTPSVINLMDGDIRALNVLSQILTKLSPALNLSDEVMEEPAKNVHNKDILLNTTVLTQGMIEELLNLKSKEENDSYQQMNIETNQETTVLETEMKTNHTLVGLIKNDEILCPTAETVDYDIHTEYLHIKVENDDNTAAQDNSTTNRVDLSNIKDNSATNQLGNSTIDYFIEMGIYVKDHFSEEKQKEFRTMLWALIQEELELLHK